MIIERYRPEELLKVPSCVAHGGFNMFEIGSTHLARVLQLATKFISNKHPEQRTDVHTSRVRFARVLMIRRWEPR